MDVAMHTEFNRAAASDLCAGDDYSLFARAILADLAPGSVFMDDPEHPACLAVLSTEEARCYLAACAPADAAATGPVPVARFDQWRAAVETVLAYRAEQDDEAIEFHLPPTAPAGLAELLLSTDAGVGKAWLYAADMATWSAPSAPLPAGYTVVPINAAFRARADIANLELLTDEWSARQAGPGGVSGMAVLENKSLTALCHIDFMEGDVAEIGVITEENHRRRGLAAAAAVALVAHCRAAGLRQVIWHAPKDNAGSIACAERAGLVRGRPIVEYYLQARPSNRLLMRGRDLYRAGDHRGAAALYRRAMDLELAALDPFGGWASQAQMADWIAAAEAAATAPGDDSNRA